MRAGWGAAGIFLFTATLWALAPVAGQGVRQDLNLGRADAALRILDPALAQNPTDAEAHSLRCRVYYQEEQWDAAIADCEAAVQLAPNSSDDALWLGRAYGRKAAHGSLVSAYKLARKVHTEFEEAVRLDPHNGAALADLGQFDVDAPAMVGGGVTSAEPILVQLRTVDPVRASTLQARIAEARKDYVSAEAAYKVAIAQSPHPAGLWIDLAQFYGRRGHTNEMLAALDTAVKLDRRHGPALVEAAAVLTQAGRDPQTAMAWLTEYLNSHAQAESAPAFVVRARLARLLAMQGNPQAAQVEFAAVHALASGYRIPAAATSATAGE
ncbi:MAG TPA: tetratricopeptide repeat protein [Acidobacteriaceae bacterium]|nr:tetratricopeptide repeat protein [Acidobacteriaceae bacterium]